jgi:hypothetical protein
LQRASRLAGGLRFVFMPLGLFALLAVGVHAAADTLDDRLLWLIDQLDAGFDALVGGFALTSSWVGWVELEDRTTLARGLALLWELLAVAVLALPVLGYREAERRHAPQGLAGLLGTPARGWKDIFRDVVRRPTLLRVARPLCTAALALAGGCAVGRMVQGAVYLGSRELLGDDWAGPLGRALALGALCGVLLSFGARAVLYALYRADRLAVEEGRGVPYLKLVAMGLPGTAVVLPLGAAALLDASPLLSFFR